MSEDDVLRDVYFWSHETGLLSFPVAAFRANARQERICVATVRHPFQTAPGTSEAQPEARFLTEQPPDSKQMLRSLHAFGLLWTTSAERPNVFPHVIPACITNWDWSRREMGDGRTLWDHTIRWRSEGPFVADGFSVPTVIEPEPAPA